MMKSMRILAGRTTTDDALVERLRDEARAFDPPVPGGVRRRIFSELAARPATGGAAASAGSRAMFMRVLGAVGLAGAVVALILVARPNRPTPDNRVTQQTTPKPTTPYAFAAADPNSLARRWVDQPIEAELQNLMSGLSQAGETVAGVLPAAPKRAAKVDGAGGA